MRTKRFFAVGGLLVILSIFAGCTQPTGGTTGSSASISHVYYVVYNTPADWWSAASTVKPELTYYFAIKFDGSISLADVASANIYLPNSNTLCWTLRTNTSGGFFEASSQILSGSGFLFQDEPCELPVGTMTAVVTLTNGTILKKTLTSGVPGNTDNGTCSSLYSEGFTAIPTSRYTKALMRPTITSATSVSGSSVSLTFTVNGANVHNGSVWLYDSAGLYIGHSPWFRSSTTGQCFAGLNGGSGFMITDGASNTITLTASSVYTDNGYSVGQTAFGKIAKARAVVFDGAQYESATYSGYDHKSISPMFTIP
jgi:hypothetical protein